MYAERDKLLKSYQSGDFLETIYDCLQTNKNDPDAIAPVLVSLHNEGLINIVEAFKSLKKNESSGRDFFILRDVFEKVLPDIEASVISVMECVLHLYREVAGDGAGGTIFKPFSKYCEKQCSRPRGVISHIQSNPEKFAALLPANIIAGFKADRDYFLKETTSLCKSRNLELRRGAIHTIGVVDLHEDMMLCSAITILENVVDEEKDDIVLSGILKSAFKFSRQDRTQEQRCIEIIKSTLTKGRENTFNEATLVFSNYTSELPDKLFDLLHQHFVVHINPENKLALYNIDLGISNLIKNGNSARALHLLKELLLKCHVGLTMGEFDGTARRILRDEKLISKVTTQWFLSGNKALCNGVAVMIGSQYANKIELQLEVDSDELQSTENIKIIFVARKAVGYLFDKPLSVASIIISLMRQTENDELLDDLGELLFDPLLISASYELNDFIFNRSKKEKTPKVQKSIKRALNCYNNYMKDLRSVGILPALHPGEAERALYHMHFTSLYAEAYRKAEDQSIFRNLVTKSTLLYGKKCVLYVKTQDRENKRMEMSLKSHISEIKAPPLLTIDPFGLDYTLRVFRNEKL